MNILSPPGLPLYWVPPGRLSQLPFRQLWKTASGSTAPTPSATVLPQAAGINVSEISASRRPSPSVRLCGRGISLCAVKIKAVSVSSTCYRRSSSPTLSIGSSRARLWTSSASLRRSTNFYFDVFTKEILAWRVGQRRGARDQYIDGLKDVVDQLKGCTEPANLRTILWMSHLTAESRRKSSPISILMRAGTFLTMR